MPNELADWLGVTLIHADTCPDCDSSASVVRSPLGLPTIRVHHSPTCVHHPRARRRARIRRARAAIAAFEGSAR